MDEKEWLKIMKKSLENAEKQQDEVPTNVQDAIRGITPDVWNAIVNKKIHNLKEISQTPDKHKELQPVIEYLSGRPIQDTRHEDIKRVLGTQNGQAKVQAIAGLMEAVDRGAANQSPIMAAGTIQGVFKDEHSFKDRVKDLFDDILDFLGNVLAGILGY